MRIAKVLAVLGFVLAGCDVPTATISTGAESLDRGDRVVEAPRPAPSQSLPQSERAMARAFVSVVDTLEPVAERECRRRAPRLDCDFLIVVDDRPQQPNAFQTLDENGRPIIAFTLSLIMQMRNTDEIAFVMAHEAAHHIENHLAQQQRNATLGAVVFGQHAGATGGGNDAVRTAQEIGAALGARTYSKDFELEADRLGTIIAARAGYNPVRGAAFFNRIPDPGDQFLGTHPPNADRVRVVQQTAAGL